MVPNHFAMLFVSLVTLASASSAKAQLTLNFQPHDTTFGDHALPDTRCNRAEGANLGCSGSWSHLDSTPFLQELFYDASTGASYYHVIVGRPQDGFAQEVFIKANGPTWEGGLGSASLGDGSCRFGFGPSNFDKTSCNLGDPLGATHDNNFTGIGSGNPKVVLMRQIIGGTWDETSKTWSCALDDTFCMEFLKDNFLLKPVITQTARDNDRATGMTAFFEFDMRNSNYDTNTIAGTLINTLSFKDDTLNILGDFDYAIDKDTTTLLGGRYIFTGSGPTNAVSEPYIYYDSDFKLDRDWTFIRP